MESTGIYWIPVFEILESHGLEVKLVPMSMPVRNITKNAIDLGSYKI
jgi:hypothetical protein